MDLAAGGIRERAKRARRFFHEWTASLRLGDLGTYGTTHLAEVL
jgi:hypothetical protein